MFGFIKRFIKRWKEEWNKIQDKKFAQQFECVKQELRRMSEEKKDRNDDR